MNQLNTSASCRRRSASRREFVAGAIALVAAPLAAGAQQPRNRPLIAFLGAQADSPTGLRRQIVPALAKAGWVEGQNFDAVWRFANGDLARLAGLAREIVSVNPDIILAASTATVVELHKLTSTIPIVGTVVSDPIGLGLSSSFARPDRNFTGTIASIESLSGKILDIALDLMPATARVGVLSNPQGPNTPAFLVPVLEVAKARKVELVSADVSAPDQIDQAIAFFARERVDFILPTSDPLFSAERIRIVQLALAVRLPVVHQYKYMVDAGGLMSYGPSSVAMVERGAYFVDRLLRGAKISDLPLEFAMTFELAINLITAKALGIAIPEIVMLRATDVIE
jgi:putative tryptophan/tyrosine transport system substrate-binding protein